MDLSDKYIDIHKQTYGGHSLVKGREDDSLYVMKRMEFYEIKVFEFIRDNRNIHIPRVYDFWEEDGILTVVEEYINGKTLDKYLEVNTLTRNDRKKIITDILDGLEFLHTATVPIIHRDLKDTNVMITNDGVVKIIDYDAAKTFKAGESKDTMLVGTAGSAAPEQYGFSQSDPRTDIYAVGMLMKQLFEGDTLYESIMIKATRMDPKQRYQTVAEMRRAFRFDVGRDFDRLRKPLIITAGALAGSIFILWGVWFIKFSRTTDEHGNIIYVNPIQQAFEQLTVDESEKDPEWIEYNGETYPYSPDLLESLENPDVTTPESGTGMRAVLETPSGRSIVSVSGTVTPTSGPARYATNTPTPVDTLKLLDDLNANRERVFFYSRPQLIDLLMEECDKICRITRPEAEEAVDFKHYDYNERAAMAARCRNFEAEGETGLARLSPKQMESFLLSQGFTASQARSGAYNLTYESGSTYVNHLLFDAIDCIRNHTYPKVSQLMNHFKNEGYTQSYIDSKLPNSGPASMAREEIRRGNLIDDIGYFAVSTNTPTRAPETTTPTTAPVATETPVPTSPAPATPTPVPTTPPETEATTQPDTEPEDEG